MRNQGMANGPARATIMSLIVVFFKKRRLEIRWQANAESSQIKAGMYAVTVNSI